MVNVRINPAKYVFSQVNLIKDYNEDTDYQ